MLGDEERKVLEIISRHLLMRKEELMSALKKEGFDDGASVPNHLISMGYVKFVDAVGSPCYTITHDGMKALKE